MPRSVIPLMSRKRRHIGSYPRVSTCGSISYPRVSTCGSITSACQDLHGSRDTRRRIPPVSTAAAGKTRVGHSGRVPASVRTPAVCTVVCTV
eukprot:3090354-Rhodomonas_salina.2